MAPAQSTLRPYAVPPMTPHKDHHTFSTSAYRQAWHTATTSTVAGLLSLVADEARFTAISGHSADVYAADCAGVLHEPPADVTDVTGNNLKLHALALAKYSTLQASLHDFTQQLVEALPESIKGRLDTQFGDCCRMSAKEILDGLDLLYSRGSVVDIEHAMAGLAQHLLCPSMSAMQAHINRIRETQRYLDRQSQGLNPLALLGALRSTVAHTKLADGSSAYGFCVSQYQMSHRDVAAQSFDELAADLLYTAEIQDQPAVPPGPTRIGALYGLGAATDPP
jgi:hypothetical protein